MSGLVGLELSKRKTFSMFWHVVIKLSCLVRDESSHDISEMHKQRNFMYVAMYVNCEWLHKNFMVQEIQNFVDMFL